MNSNAPNNAAKNHLKLLKDLDNLNRASAEDEMIDPNQMLAVAISTTVALAMDKREVLTKEHYQWSRIYFNGIRDETGLNPHNTGLLLEIIKRIEAEQNITEDPEIEEANESTIYHSAIEPSVIAISSGDESDISINSDEMVATSSKTVLNETSIINFRENDPNANNIGNDP